VAIAWGVRNRVSSENLGGDIKIVAETRFLGFWGGLWGVRNRVSFLNLGGDSEIVAETRFLGFWGIFGWGVRNRVSC
jgi:hypothetical protein